MLQFLVTNVVIFVPIATVVTIATFVAVLGRSQTSQFLQPLQWSQTSSFLVTTIAIGHKRRIFWSQPSQAHTKKYHKGDPYNFLLHQKKIFSGDAKNPKGPPLFFICEIATVATKNCDVCDQKLRCLWPLRQL